MENENKSFGLYEIFMERLKKVGASCKKEIMPFPLVFQRMCLSFSLTKKECWKVLFSLRDTGFIDIVPYHGVRLNED